MRPPDRKRQPPRGYKSGDTVFQGRLVNRVSGQYKGWQLSRDEWPGGIDQFDWERRHGGD